LQGVYASDAPNVAAPAPPAKAPNAVEGSAGLAAPAAVTTSPPQYPTHDAWYVRTANATEGAMAVPAPPKAPISPPTPPYAARARGSLCSTNATPSAPAVPVKVSVKVMEKDLVTSRAVGAHAALLTSPTAGVIVSVLAAPEVATAGPTLLPTI
jgi:hypothetical protein